MAKITDSFFPPKYSGSEFIKHSLVLFLGSTLAQSLSVLLYPAFSRLFSPEQFGTYALFLSITGIMAFLSSGVYEQAILLPREDKDALTLLVLSLMLTLAQCLIFLITILFFGDYIAEKMLNNAQIKPFLLLVPVSIILNNIYAAFTFYANRRKYYAYISQSSINQGIGINISKLVFGLSGLTKSGLILGRIIGQFTAAVQLLVQVMRKSRITFQDIKAVRGNLKQVAVTYKNFPKFRMPLALMNTFSTALPILALSKYFTAWDAGQYSLAAGVMLTPVTLIVGSVSKVMNQKIIERVNARQPVLNYIIRALLTIMPVTAVLFFIFYFFSAPVFVFLFGADWQEAGRIGGLLLPWVFLVLFTTPFGFVPDMFFRQKKAMIIDALYLIMRLAALAIGILNKNIMLAIGLFVLSGCVILSYNLIWYLSLLKDHDKSIMTDKG